MIGSRSAFSRVLFRGAGIIVALLLHVSAQRAQVTTPSANTTAAIISGRVITKEGAPISDARVVVSRLAAASLSQSRSRVDGSGTFSSEPPSSCLYLLSVGAVGEGWGSPHTSPDC